MCAHPLVQEAPDDGPITTEAIMGVALLWPSFQGAIERWAERLSSDADDQDDLIQVAMIALWQSDPTAYDFLVPTDVAFLCRVMKRRMLDVWGRHRTRLAKQVAEGKPRNIYSRRIPAKETEFAIMPVSHLRALVAQIQEGRMRP